jgi:lipopolysaccharide/colanic/teichoic acid biosynthesis glycosyltransferase
MYKHFFKPLIDFLAAFFSLLLLSPLLILVGIFIAIANRGNPFFIQKRPGKDERIFQIIKFKTMNDKKDENGNLLSDAERLTTIGRVIRKASIDELPQLINVLKGDMSLIGPRPLLPQYLELYNEKQKQRHLTKPGITGWAQVNGRNAISWQQKFGYDVWYVNNINFILDVKIILMTLKKVFTSKDIAADGSATVSRFNGNN